MKKLLFLPFVFILCLVGCSNTKYVTDTSFMLNTVVSITIYNSSDKGVISEAFELIRHYENLFSRTTKGSDVWNINNSGGQPTVVDAETAEVILSSIYYSEISDGAFDITIGSVSSLWDFTEKVIPSSEKISSLLPTVGYKNIVVSGNTVTLNNGANIDLGGIAKGYIAKKLVEFLEARSVTSATINLGGSVSVIGNKNNKPFVVGIQKPFSKTGDIITSVEATDLSVVTSGSYQRGFEYNDKLYHHILDVKTGYPVDATVKSTTIIAKDPVFCDAMSTITFIFGPEKSFEILKKFEGSYALFVTLNDKIVTNYPTK